MILKNKFNLNSIRESYDDLSLTPPDLINDCYKRIEKDSKDKIWISLRKRSDAIKIAEFVSASPRKNKPLWGIPFSVKDNIDVEGLATTAACPKYSYFPEKSSPVVQALENAGAICLGKTNLDQFATGLNGTRSPYGVCVPQFLMMNIYLVVLVRALLFQLLKNKFVFLLELIQVDQDEYLQL